MEFTIRLKKRATNSEIADVCAIHKLMELVGSMVQWPNR